jgi:hypothetical protein
VEGAEFGFLLRLDETRQLVNVGSNTDASASVVSECDSPVNDARTQTPPTARLFPDGVIGVGRDALLLGGEQNRASGQKRRFFAVDGVDGQVGGTAQHH